MQLTPGGLQTSLVRTELECASPSRRVTVNSYPMKATLGIEQIELPKGGTPGKEEPRPDGLGI